MRLSPAQIAGSIDLQAIEVPIVERRCTYVRVVVWQGCRVLLDVDLCCN